MARAKNKAAARADKGEMIMRWRKKMMKIVRRFALFPICISYEYRWMEVVYIRRFKRDPFILWRNDRFVSKKTFIEYKKKQSVTRNKEAKR